jgi:hypothetical protein
LGSEFAVGSWFFNSVTSKVRKSLDEMVSESLLELLVLLEVLAVCLTALPSVAAEVAVVPARACAAVA